MISTNVKINHKQILQDIQDYLFHHIIYKNGLILFYPLLILLIYHV